MVERKGDHLFVNLGASQARRRLKGFGHGVRHVETAGKNRALIVHTATGQHLDELQAKFADVGFAQEEFALSEPIENLRNLGPKSGAWLRAAGIGTIADLEKLGAAVAYRIVKQQHSEATLNLLWGLAAGLKDIDWRDLTKADRQALLNELKELNALEEE